MVDKQGLFITFITALVGLPGLPGLPGLSHRPASASALRSNLITIIIAVIIAADLWGHLGIALFSSSVLTVTLITLADRVKPEWFALYAPYVLRVLQAI